MDDQKEFFRLWWGYLRRSARYKNFCEKFGTPDEFYDPNLEFTFNENGDVHRPPLNGFESWYQFKMNLEAPTFIWQAPFDKSPIEVTKKPAVTGIKYAQEWVLANLDSAADRLRKKLNREPTLQEFQDFYSGTEGVYRDVSLCAFVVDPVSEHTNKEVCGDIQAFLKGSAFRKKTIKYDELQTYLDVFDLFEKYQDIHKVIKRHSRPDYDPAKTEEADTLQRYYRRYRYKAEQIIKNTEQNYFPGGY